MTFRGVKLFYMILSWWIHDNMHLSKPIEYITTESKSECKLYTLGNKNVSILVLSFNKCNTLIQDINYRGGCIGRRGKR